MELAEILAAELRPPTTVVLPRSRQQVRIRTLLRREVRAEGDIAKAPTCWAPNKPSLRYGDSATWEEFVITRLLRKAGWGALWIKWWTGDREFCEEVGKPYPIDQIPRAVFRQFNSIERNLPAIGQGGAWDVLAWRGRDDPLHFIEAKQHRSSDKLAKNVNELTWLESALDTGFSAENFVLVEYDAPRA